MLLLIPVTCHDSGLQEGAQEVTGCCLKGGVTRATQILLEGSCGLREMIKSVGTRGKKADAKRVQG